MTSDAFSSEESPENHLDESEENASCMMTRALSAIREDDANSLRRCFDWLERPQAETLLNECASSDAVACFSALAEATFPATNLRRSVLLMSYVCEAIYHDSVKIVNEMFGLYENNYVSQSKLFLSAMRHSSDKCFEALLPRINDTVVMTSLLDQMSLGSKAPDKFFQPLYQKVSDEDFPSLICSHLSGHSRFLEDDWAFLDNFVGELPDHLFEEIYPHIHAHVREKHLEYIAARRSKLDMLEAVGHVETSASIVKPRRM